MRIILTSLLIFCICKCVYIYRHKWNILSRRGLKSNKAPVILHIISNLQRQSNAVLAYYRNVNDGFEFNFTRKNDIFYKILKEKYLTVSNSAVLKCLYVFFLYLV